MTHNSFIELEIFTITNFLFEYKIICRNNKYDATFYFIIFNLLIFFK